MGFEIKPSLLLYFLIFFHAILLSSITLASVDPNHDNLPVQPLESKPDGNVIAGKSPELTVVVKKGGGGGGGGHGGGGGGGHGFSGGGGHGGGEGGHGVGEGGHGISEGGRSRGDETDGVGGVHPFPTHGGGSQHGGKRSSGDRESTSGWLGLSSFVGLVFFF